ncbi:unnamed protein product [Adineta steineri]|uniref:G-protein coupled receptors family 1 profile domain-containing protein n=1 Tax=Adineta steineri TaxID=433720 RepID=A0A813XLW0_9BILA|nr:unnamed protein product [Adineta steineri]CAF3844716.1 unnamed protein product [Adineta steineri]
MDLSLIYLGQQFTIYGSLVFLLMGVFGNSMNILVFSSVRTYRTNPCSFYFLVGSIFDNLYLLINLTTRLVSTISGVDSTTTSLIWCKIRQFCIVTPSVITLSCSSLATIDQFLVTSKHARLRRCSSIKSAHWIVFIVIIFWCLHGIPCLVTSNIVGDDSNKDCTITNATYSVYIPIFIFLFLCTIPMFIMILFGCLAYRNIQQTTHLAEQHVDRQLMRMVLTQVVLVVVSNTPFGAVTAYDLITAGINKDLNRQLKEYFAICILILVSYSYYIGNFYIFFISSSRFRQTLKDRIFWWRRPIQINPSRTS